MKKPIKCYVYIYLDPRKQGEFIFDNYRFNCEPFYVGKGSQYRHSLHLSRSHSQSLMSKVKKIKSEGLKPITIILEDGLNDAEAFELEKKMIQLIGRKDFMLGTLINHSDGGEGECGRITSPEARQKLRERNLGKKASKETKLKMSLSRIGRVVTEETKRKIGEAQKGKPRRTGWIHTEDAKAKMRKPKSDEAIANMKTGWKSRPPMSDEQKEKIRQTLTGRQLSEEHKAKLRGKGANAGSFVKGQSPWNKGTRA